MMDLTRRPTGAELRAVRDDAGLTQEQGASAVDVTSRQWKKWEADAASMPLALWWLLLLRLGKIKAADLPPLPERTRF